MILCEFSDKETFLYSLRLKAVFNTVNCFWTNYIWR
ncbi:hypothetical protein SAMN06265379_104158 [Saccharicrinis carchari]|uniref:Uncharacterized protein n=1 Tax=Saccharicrinis carchari TaxID=1168039 RepID=A0A521D5G7_SACCC|nr:hypothetical protein SAMN06265379_104158 [Saccharicrinis carchari]